MNNNSTQGTQPIEWDNLINCDKYEKSKMREETFHYKIVEDKK